ncbi:MAG: ABC transporter substrate-binding protein [Thermocrispum sp.]
MSSRFRRRTRLAAGLTVTLVLATGCFADSGGLRLTVATFGEFGYGELLDTYEREHQGVKITARVTDFDSHHKALATALGAGRGAPDVVAVEEQYMPQMRRSAAKFTDLRDFGAGKLRERWVDWKWAGGLAGKKVIGLGTDMGGLAMCYRRDLFTRAGLPADRDAVARAWPTWADYAELAEEFATASGAADGVAFTDSAANVFQSMVSQLEENYFATDGTYVAGTNSQLKRAFTLAGRLGADGRTAAVQPFTQAWSVAIRKGSMATVACPSWMLALIREAAGPSGKGKWDIAAVPGRGGNRGGSYLAVPAQTEHAREAYRLAAWLTAPEQQRRNFLTNGILPSCPEVYRDPQIRSRRDPYFSHAPVGRIYAAAADSLRPTFRGVDDAKVRPRFDAALGRVEEGGQTVTEAFAAAVDQGRDALGGR